VGSRYARDRKLQRGQHLPRVRCGAHEKMSDYFFTNAPGRSHLISDIAKWFFQVVASENENIAWQ